MRTTVKVKLRYSQGVTHLGRVVYVVIQAGESRRISTGIPVRKEDWDEVSGKVKENGEEAKAANEQICRDVASLNSIIRKLDTSVGEYGLELIVSLFNSPKEQITLASFMRQEIKFKELCNHPGTARNYVTALKSFLAFSEGAEIPVGKITSELMEDYSVWLRERGVCNNSISFYMRILRAVYARMVKDGVTIDRRPFANVYTGVDKTRKRAITEADIIKIKSLNLESSEPMCFYRDMFLLSFYMMGISFVDLAFLKKSDVVGNHIVYYRSKTGQRITVGLADKIQRLLKKYPAEEESSYLLPIITDDEKDARKQYQNKLQQANKYLKIIAKEAGVTANLSTYTSRHTWASIAKAKNINIGTISDALGHQNEMTTRIYLATLDNGQIDRANEIVLKDI